ncbi:MAG: protoporphyrinogen oxidase [Ignavibacteriales bacterium]|nr:protoporphyrinogen oxidase [Ignavibacteriales bacterium]
MNPKKVDVVIVGGGISGLCAAHWLAKRGVDVLLLEKDAEVGGTMKTVREQGYLVETGPNSALETTSLFRELVTDLSLESEFLYANPSGKKRYVLREGQLRALPLSPPAFLTSRLFSAKAKLRVLKEPFIGRATHEESIAEFVIRRLGREFLDYAIDPFVAGVYAARPEHLSVQAAFPKLYALEERYGGLVRGMIKGRKERTKRGEKGKDRAETFSFRHGMQVLPLALAQSLGDRVICRSKVTLVQDLTLDTTIPVDEPGARHFRVEFLLGDQSSEVEADVVILAVPTAAAASLIQPFSRETAQDLRNIHYPPVASVFLGYAQDQIGHSLDGFGFLVPSKESRSILGSLWSSSLFPERAPRGYAGLTTFVGGSRQPELVEKSEGVLIDLVAGELETAMQVRGKPVYWKVTKWPRAIPQYELGYLRTMDGLGRFEEEHPGLFLSGNYRGGISVGDCVTNASAMAERVGKYLSLPAVRSIA